MAKQFSITASTDILGQADLEFYQIMEEAVEALDVSTLETLKRQLGTGKEVTDRMLQQSTMPL